MKRWSAAEDKVLKDHASTLTAKQIGHLLGRTAKSIGARAAVVGIELRKRGDAYHGRKYSEADIEMARQLHSAGMGLRLVAEKMEIPFASLKNYFY
ncbi:DNA-binding protein [Serratia sp. MYb239]|uniref:DNA-binding protein n=1 Tax=Serratia sp. MYb239 TaxID=2033438 RepID=UPI000CF646A9|nr:DNA-binding protein [Serratia sp. MYb239]AVJ17185.1 DNA-binding protein [Serratia sp. MYb239]